MRCRTAVLVVLAGLGCSGADVLLLGGDPSADIRATRTLEVVIQDGGVIDREALLAPTDAAR